MIHHIMLSPIFAAINIFYRKINIQCHEKYANFIMYVYNDYKTTLIYSVVCKLCELLWSEKWCELAKM